MWRKDLSDGTHALLLYNGGDATRDISARWNEVIADAAQRWAQTVPREPPCFDKGEAVNCKNWARTGECERNHQYMVTECMQSCGACPEPLWQGSQATALVRDAWEQEYKGIYTAMYTARHVESHEARVLVLRFEQPGDQQKQTLQKMMQEDSRKREAGRRERRAGGRTADAEASPGVAASAAAAASPRDLGEVSAADASAASGISAGECAGAYGVPLVLVAVPVLVAFWVYSDRRMGVKSDRHAV